jgi:hypothetical protein
MSQNQPSDKTDNGKVRLSCGEFFSHLYAHTNPDLWLELRCIDPTGTQKPRVLWSPLKNTIKALREAATLNKAGYGIYFAPCPRTTQRGSAESAALLPALWVDLDCDGEAVQRRQALEKLHAFPIPPTAIIDSGGGWHAYWLLATPLPLDEPAQRQRAEDYLRGLFQALGADPQYVKSVASIMRLPNSVNTKPERDGSVTRFVEFYPDRCVELSAFDWVLPTTQPSNSLPETKRRLPPPTLAYLAHGAVTGTRNKALFDAACQFRDAGFAQVEASVQLIPRYVADGAGENPAAREREAETTIASVYTHPPREPLAVGTGHQQVDTLLARHSTRPSTVSTRVSVQELAEAVKACASLDAVAWAEERQHLKLVCGETVKLADLDRLYREARRDFKRSQVASELVTQEGYLELDGCMVYEKRSERGVLRNVVAEWIGHAEEWISQITEEGQMEHLMRLKLMRRDVTTTLDVPSELFGDTNALQRFIAQKSGGVFAANAGMNKHLVSAILKLSGDIPRRQTYRMMGWTKAGEHWVYVSPGRTISAASLDQPTQEVELEHRLQAYGLQSTNSDDSLKAFEAAISVFPTALAPTLIAFTLLPVLQRFFPAAVPKPALHLVGTSGSGKSEIAALMTSFYGSFTRDTPPAQWGDTVNTVEALGYQLADALYWVDDYKTSYADERTFTRFLQSYSRGMGRGRLTREAKLREDRPCRGLLLSTGETMLAGEASILSRMLVLEISPWEQRDPGGQKLVLAEDLRAGLVGFTAQFVNWLARQVEGGSLTEMLASSFDRNAKQYRTHLRATLGQQAHMGRMVQNWAALHTVYQVVTAYLETLDSDNLLPLWQDGILASVTAVQEERAGHVFIAALEELLASGEAVLTSVQAPQEGQPGITIVGYRDAHYVYLLPEISYRAIQRIRPLNFSAAAIGSQLKEDGWLVPSGSDSHLTTQLRIRGNRARVWRLKATLLSGDTGDIGDNPTST